MEKRQWTDGDLAILKSEFEKGTGLAKIGKMIGRSESGVKYKVKSLGLARERPSGIRQLTEDEIQFIRDNHESMSMRAMARALGVAWNTIDARMKELGIKTELASKPWSELDMHKFRLLAAEGKSVEEIASVLDRTETAIEMKAKKTGIVIYRDGRKWTIEELDYLRRNYGYISVSAIAKHVHRSVDAVCQQAHKMRLGAVYELSEDISLSAFCENTGISRDRVMGTLVPKYDFPLVSKKYGKRQYYYFVDMEKILPWMERHQGLFDGSRIKYGFFVEPEWLRAKMRRDLDDNSYLPYDVIRRKWTKQEIDHVKLLLDMGYDYAQIAGKINRSARAIKWKMYNIGATWRLKAFWKGREFKFLRENWQTMTDREIAMHLGRTEGGVANQRANMGFYRDNCLRGTELDYVRDNWIEMSDSDMAEHLKKSLAAVKNARYRMGLYRPELHEWTQEEEDFIADNWESMSDAEMGTRLGRPRSGIEARRKALGLYRKKMQEDGA